MRRRFSKHLIDAYKFLESIHPETHEKDAEGFGKTVATNIADWHYKSLTAHHLRGWQHL
ncbi:MAG: hypothetical protein IPF78_11585 [Flavobacteriales bacterium]|nr:hypothetical protein [Flavobacteriales bacterium]